MTAALEYNDVQNRRDDLIRKALEGSLYMAASSADPITALTTGGTAAVVGTSGTLSAASIVGATSVSSSQSYPSGTKVTIGAGGGAETVTTTGAPTGTGPFTLPVPALAKAHASGAAITSSQSAVPVGLNPLPAGWDDTGWCTSAGFVFSSSVTVSDTASFGSATPTRSDNKAEAVTLKAVMQETKALNLGVFIGVDPATIQADPLTREIGIASPLIPASRYWRALTVGVDLTDDGEIYIAQDLPRVKVSDKDDQGIDGGDDGVTYGVTLTALPDPVRGYARKFYIGGPGVTDDLLEAMNIAKAGA